MRDSYLIYERVGRLITNNNEEPTTKLPERAILTKKETNHEYELQTSFFMG